MAGIDHTREVVGGGASGAAAQPIFWDLYYELPPGGQSLSSAGPTKNLQPATSLNVTTKISIFFAY